MCVIEASWKRELRYCLDSAYSLIIRNHAMGARYASGRDSDRGRRFLCCRAAGSLTHRFSVDESRLFASESHQGVVIKAELLGLRGRQTKIKYCRVGLWKS